MQTLTKKLNSEYINIRSGILQSKKISHEQEENRE